MIDYYEEEQRNGDTIKCLLQEMAEDPHSTGFEVYVVVNSENGKDEYLKKMELQSEGEESFRDKVKKVILDVIKEQYLSDDAQYVSVNRIADEQDKYYIIPTGEDHDYNPFAVFNQESRGSFNNKDIVHAKGFGFKLTLQQRTIWAYQHIWGMMLPSKSQKNLLARMISSTAQTYFDEMTDPIITIVKKVDLIQFEKYLVTKDYKLLQTKFDFKEYIMANAEKTIQNIKEKDFIRNIEKLTEYIERGNGKLGYAKKIMRVSNSKVLSMPLDQLMVNIRRSERWNGKIEVKGGKFVLNSYSQVELMIDLLDERYTKSEITGEEYDTSVKKPAKK